MGSIGTGELLLIFFVVLLVFGAKRIPEIARNMGTAISEFRSATREIQRQLDVDSAVNPPRSGHAHARERQLAGDAAQPPPMAEPSVAPSPAITPTPDADPVGTTTAA